MLIGGMVTLFAWVVCFVMLVREVERWARRGR